MAKAKTELKKIIEQLKQLFNTTTKTKKEISKDINLEIFISLGALPGLFFLLLLPIGVFIGERVELGMLIAVIILITIGLLYGYLFALVVNLIESKWGNPEEVSFKKIAKRFAIFEIIPIVFTLGDSDLLGMYFYFLMISTLCLPAGFKDTLKNKQLLL